MTGGEKGGRWAGMMGWAQDARVRSAAYAAQAARAAESAAAIGQQVDRRIERLAARNPEHAECLQAILVAAARQRRAAAEWTRSCTGGQLLPEARTGPEAAASTEPEGHGHDMAVIPDPDRTADELQDRVTEGIFSAGLLLQDAAGLTTEPGVRWRIEAAADGLDELIRMLRGALFDPAGQQDRGPGRGADDSTLPAR
jgi:hypothetical protein